MKKSVLGAAVGALVALCGFPAAAQTRTPWQMHDGLEVTASNPLGLVKFSCSPSQHGAICEYDGISPPPAQHSGWTDAPDGEIIALDAYSRVCQAPTRCLAYGDFTYFQTFVNVPANVAVTQFTIAFSGMDDGSRVSIFNSQYPDGLVIPGSYVYYGGSGTTNLAPYIQSGETNRVVITQVDDCCPHNVLQRAVVVLNGQQLPSSCHGAADCEDGNTCTGDVCNPDGTCSNPVLVCANGQMCNPNPASSASNASSCTQDPGQPMLRVHGDLNMTLECGQSTWTDPGAEAWDAGCTPLPVQSYNSGHDAYGPGPNTCAEGTYAVQYATWNGMGQTVSAIRSVTVNDTTPPAFTLKGPAHMTHTCGSQWVDPGWGASDMCYGNISSEVRRTGQVNGWVPGTYTVTYRLTDSGGNSAPSLTRTVSVVNCPW